MRKMTGSVSLICNGWLLVLTMMLKGRAAYRRMKKGVGDKRKRCRCAMRLGYCCALGEVSVGCREPETQDPEAVHPGDGVL